MAKRKNGARRLMGCASVLALLMIFAGLTFGWDRDIFTALTARPAEGVPARWLRLGDALYQGIPGLGPRGDRRGGAPPLRR